MKCQIGKIISLIFYVLKICIKIFSIAYLSIPYPTQYFHNLQFLTIIKNLSGMIEKKNNPMEQAVNSKILEKYKQKLLIQVIIVFAICLIVILERVFYEVIVQSEEKTLSSLQLSSDLSHRIDQKVEPQSITNGFLQFYGFLSRFDIQFLLLTHLLASFYVGIDALMGAKLVYVMMGLIYLVSVLQMLYGGGRPFWQNDEILTSCCLNSYNHPSLGFILSIIIPLYTFYCWKNKASNFLKGYAKKHIFIVIIYFVVISVIQFVNYFIGLMFLINIAISLVFITLIMMILASANSPIDKAIKKSTVFKVDAKKYVFYWLLLLCLLQTLALIIYSGQDLFLDIDWVQNYLSCTKYLDYPSKTYKFDEVVGPWFNLVQTTCIFGWIGAIFGISACFRKIDNVQWAQGRVIDRIKRVAVTNLFIIPSWLFVLLLQDLGTWIEDIGMNDFIVNAVHFFFLYLWIFGYLPVLVFDKLLKWTNKQKEDFFVIVKEKQDSMEQSSQLRQKLVQKQQKD